MQLENSLQCLSSICSRQQSLFSTLHAIGLWIKNKSDHSMLFVACRTEFWDELWVGVCLLNCGFLCHIILYLFLTLLFYLFVSQPCPPPPLPSALPSRLAPYLFLATYRTFPRTRRRQHKTVCPSSAAV